MEEAIGDEPVDVSDVGDIALDARDWWNARGTRVKQIADFLRRTTDPDQPDLTFSEARDFLSNAGRRLSAQESQQLVPQAKRYLAQFASSLDDAIQDVANDAGLGDQYRDAIDEYRGAMKLNNAWETTKQMGAEMAKKAIQNAPWVGGAYAIARSICLKRGQRCGRQPIR